MDIEDVSRILAQVYESNPEEFEDWIEANVCPNCSGTRRKIFSY